MKKLFATSLLVLAGAAGGFAQAPAAAPTPTPPPLPATEEKPSAQTPVAPAASPGAAKVQQLYALDYDENKDVFYVVGTKTPFTGPVVSTYQEGGKELEGALKDGKEDGPWTSYYENGKKSEEGSYRAGVEEGPWTYWHENGQVDSKGSYRGGSPTGLWVKFFENGKPDSEGVYVDGLMHGAWKYHDESTGEVRVIKFDHGTQLTP